MPTTSDNLDSIDLQQLINIRNWQAQFRLLTEWSELIQHKPQIRVEKNRIKGCETSAWLKHQQQDGHHYFYFDSDSKIIRGLASIVLKLADGKTTAQILELDLENILGNLGIRSHLTPSRSNGFRAIVERVKSLSNDPDC